MSSSFQKAIMFKTKKSSAVHSIGLGINGAGHRMLLVQPDAQAVSILVGECAAVDFVHLITTALRDENVSSVFEQIKRKYVNPLESGRYAVLSVVKSNGVFIERYEDISMYASLEESIHSPIPVPIPMASILALEMPNLPIPINATTDSPWAW
jgi:hypothetical protein